MDREEAGRSCEAVRQEEQESRLSGLLRKGDNLLIAFEVGFLTRGVI